MTVLLQVVINGILLGSMYGIAAAGLSLIFGTMRIIFLAQGTMIVFFAFVVYWLFVKAPYRSLSLPAHSGASRLLGGSRPVLLPVPEGSRPRGQERHVAARGGTDVPGRQRDAEGLVCHSALTVTISYSDAMIVAGGIRVPWLRLALLGLAFVSALVVFLFLKRTRVGTAVRAASEDLEATKIQGINAIWVCAISFAVGIGLAGVAGVGMATVFSFDYQFGFTWAIKALVALALGGIGNVFGALAGGLILGIIENLAAYYWGIAWIDVASYGLFMLVLIFLPQGLFGRRALVKKV